MPKNCFQNLIWMFNKIAVPVISRNRYGNPFTFGYLLFCEQHHNFIASLYKCGHFFRIQRFMCQHCQII